MFRRVLIANRGEIAARIARSLRDLQVESVALFTASERDAPHTLLADHAVEVPASGKKSTFLDGPALLDLARRFECDAIHPGYGFLSESAPFAAACEEARICFIGPPAASIETMGTKVRARETMAAAGVPVVPGGEAHNLASAHATAQSLGYPVMLKAVHGGGGKGMRRLENEQQLTQGYEAAQGEALRAFGQGDVYLEKIVTRARHVEIQILADRHGNCVHLFERDCSMQRRHQKIIEETPCPVLSEATVKAMGDVAVRGARALGYFSAGTFEFLVGEQGQFYFLEMNTRLQVEHPITEWITGLDLVTEMVRIAAGEQLTFDQTTLQRRGAAVECRIYAEDPAQGFRPAPGSLRQVRYPRGHWVRVDDGADQNSKVGAEFDPMIAKISTWGRDRPEALARMRRALFETQFSGITTNLGFLTRLLDDAAFKAGDYDTGYVERAGAQLTLEQDPAARHLAAVAAAASLAHLEAQRVTRPNAERPSPWLLQQRQRLGRRP